MEDTIGNYISNTWSFIDLIIEDNNTLSNTISTEIHRSFMLDQNKDEKITVGMMNFPVSRQIAGKVQ